MGLFDCRCMITGVSLKVSQTVVVLLGQTETAYYPAALGIKGLYNRVGGIDQPATIDANMRLVLNYFRAKQQSGGGDWGPFTNIYEMLSEFADYIDWDDASVTTPGVITYALICGEVWDALVRAAPEMSVSTETLFARLFANVPEAQEIYAGRLSEVAASIRELTVVSDFVQSRGIAWTQPELPNQDEPSDMRAYLAAARQTFADSPAVLAGLNAYEFEVRNELVDEKV